MHPTNIIIARRADFKKILILEIREIMSSTENQQRFINLVQSKLSESENRWLDQKTPVLSDVSTAKKFPIFFSLAARFISSEIPQWNSEELEQMEPLYPGFGKSTWTKQDLARVVFLFRWILIDQNLKSERH